MTDEKKNTKKPAAKKPPAKKPPAKKQRGPEFVRFRVTDEQAQELAKHGFWAIDTPETDQITVAGDLTAWRRRKGLD